MRISDWSSDVCSSDLFRNGVRGKGGMPEDFDPGCHRLERLRIERFGGIVFGTHSDQTEPLQQFLGEKISAFLARNMSKPLKVLGKHSQVIHNNGKLDAENRKRVV